ncbi:hypothetical protein FA95DRAFT_1589912 [Auriscalpium vulgare]|uniref:Uncharacterized protein n=1 Tax=Auriscalpium vulgare TaxID=40419 RepID=A0ACB8RLU5_9AGAM|nr:hypothetical protein FA95DRAFT_1589912 [Auriscalpium vulgare]
MSARSTLLATYTRLTKSHHRSVHRYLSCSALRRGAADHSASSKLFADAEHEETKPPATKPVAIREYENWTGDESMEDAVLRMLVDKYKPLRSGTIRTAEEKLRQAPPRVEQGHLDATSIVSTSSPRSELPSSSFSATAEPGVILPGIEGHRPWHTTYKAPSHATSSVKYGTFTSTPSTSKTSSARALPLDDRARAKEKQARKRSLDAGRLTRAKESTLDYCLGIKKSHVQSRPNPASIKGWGGLVEERIERARLEGHFRSIKGRGKPIQRQSDDGNPFIAREEFLMNRIVQRQGAAPPWVETQGELETAVNAFREVVRQSWTRRALRMLTLEQPAALLPALTLADVTNLRDTEWEARERAYHDSALAEINSLVRKYNALAPYAVRRPYYALAAELEKAYSESGTDILAGVDERLSDSESSRRGGVDVDDERYARRVPSTQIGDLPRIRDVVRSWLRRLL